MMAVSKEILLEFGYLKSSVPRCGGKIVAVMAATVALALLITLVSGGQGQFLCLGLQQLVKFFSTLPRTNSLGCPLITSTFSCAIFSDMVYCLPSEWCVATSFYQRSANHVSFVYFLICRTCSTLSLAEQ